MITRSKSGLSDPEVQFELGCKGGMLGNTRSVVRAWRDMLSITGRCEPRL
ncbi:hypothetical protein [Variovorax guangxiensis]|nr:hypothetical protein [Variovorax guangxiensis]